MSTGGWRRNAAPLKIGEAVSHRSSFPVLLRRIAGSFSCHYYNSSDWLRGQTLARGARLRGHGVFAATQKLNPHEQVSLLFTTHSAWRCACHSPGRRTLQDWEANHDRHAALRNTRRNHPFCRGRCCGVSLVAAAGDVRLDAACDSTPGCYTHATCERDGAIGARLRNPSVSEASTAGRSPGMSGQDSRPNVSGGVGRSPLRRGARE